MSERTNTTPLICEVCNENEAAGVAASPFAPISSAYCSRCLLHPAEPRSVFAYLFECLEDGEDDRTTAARSYSTFIGGRYVSWAEYVAARRQGVLS